MEGTPIHWQPYQRPNANVVQRSLWNLGMTDIQQKQRQSESLRLRTYRLSVINKDDLVKLSYSQNGSKFYLLQRSLLSEQVGYWQQFLEQNRRPGIAQIEMLGVPPALIDDFIYWLISGEIVDDGTCNITEKLVRLYHLAVVYTVHGLRRSIIQIFYRDFALIAQRIPYDVAMTVYMKCTGLNEGRNSLHGLVTDIIVENLIKTARAGYTHDEYKALEKASWVNFAEWKARAEAILPARPPRPQPNKVIMNDMTVYLGPPS